MRPWQAAVISATLLASACSSDGDEPTTAAVGTPESTSTAVTSASTTTVEVVATTIATATGAAFSFSAEGAAGGDIFEIEIPAGSYVVTWTTEGELNFVVTPVKENGEVFSLLINELGPSAGTVSLDVPVGKEIGSLVIATTTDNPAWTLTIESETG